ncbi:hypothetical protein ACFL1M_02460 [Patescibacteria group bacterium]
MNFLKIVFLFFYYLPTPGNNFFKLPHPSFVISLSCLLLFAIYSFFTPALDVKLGAVSPNLSGESGEFIDLSLEVASVFDYDLASYLYDYAMSINTVLGISSDQESVIFPEKYLYYKLGEIESHLEIYPNSRDLLLEKGLLLLELDKKDQAAEVFFELHLLDPNNESVLEFEKLLNN